MRRAGNGTNFVFLDACRNTPLIASRSLGGGLAQPQRVPGGTFIGFATAPGETASDGSGDHGPFTQALLANLSDPGLTADQVFHKVVAQVLQNTGHHQRPWNQSSLTGDFYFMPQGAVATSPGKPLTAVLDLTAVGATKVEASALTDRLREGLLNSGDFTLLDRERMKAVFAKQATQLEACTGPTCAAELGHKLGVKKVITRRLIQPQPNLWLLSAQITDVETAQTATAVSVQYQGGYAGVLSDGITMLVARLTGKTPPVAQVVKAQQTAPPPKQSLAVPSAQPTPPPTQQPLEEQVKSGSPDWWWTLAGVAVVGAAVASSHKKSSSANSNSGSSGGSGSTGTINFSW